MADHSHNPDAPSGSARVGLDAFGSDLRPHPELEAARLAAADGLELELIGDEAQLGPALASIEHRARIELVHAATQIAMHESPARAVRGKPDASLVVAIERLAAKQIDAVVSAGNSGAVLAAALLRLGRLPELDRPAIATSFPRVHAPGRTLLLDAGANIDCKVLNLVQFAVLGAGFARAEFALARPRVAVLANGSESSKGTALTRGTHELLTRWQAQRSDAAFEFVGYVEPRELFSSACDVALTDGWTGNIVLKTAEAAMAAWPDLLRHALAKLDPDDKREGAIASVIAPALQTVARQVDPESHGGAPLLGVDGAVIICHGAAGPLAIRNALLAARRFAERGLTVVLARALEDHRELFELARQR